MDSILHIHMCEYMYIFLVGLLQVGLSLIVSPDLGSSAILCCYVCVELSGLTVN